MVIPCPNRPCGVLIRVPTGVQTKITCSRCRMSFNFGPVLIGACPRCGTMEFEQVERAGGAIQDFCRTCRWPEQAPPPPIEPSAEPAAPPRAGRLSPTISLGLAGLAAAVAAVGFLAGDGSVAQGARLALIVVGPLALLALGFTQWRPGAEAAHVVDAPAEGEQVEVSPPAVEQAPAALSEPEAAERRRFLELLQQEDFLTSLPLPAFASLVTEIFRLTGAEVLRHPEQAGGTGDAMLRDHEGTFIVRCLSAFDPLAREPFRDLHRELAKEDARGYVVTTSEIAPEALQGTSGKEITVVGLEALGRLAGEAFSEAYVLGPDFKLPCPLPEAPAEVPSEAEDPASAQTMPAAA